MTEYRIRETGQVISEMDLRLAVEPTMLPQVIGPDAQDELGVDAVLASPQPTITEYQSVVRNGVVQDSRGNWVQSWGIQDWSKEQIAEATQAKASALIKAVTDRVQERLDNFANTRGYDNIDSATKYIGCPVQSFDAEGVYCRDACALTWLKCYQIMAEVQAGLRFLPTVAEVEAELPELDWPVLNNTN